MLLLVVVLTLATAAVLVLVVRQLSSGSESQLSAALAAEDDAPQLNFARANQGWMVLVVAMPSGAKGLRYRTGEGEWSETTQPWFMLPPELRATTVQIAILDSRGQPTTAHAYKFEPERELAEGMRRNLEQTWTAWVAFRPWTGKTLIYFTHLVSNRCGLREVRYGLDGAAPTTPFELPRCLPFDTMPGAIGSGTRVSIEAPSATRSMTVDLTYFDGTHAEHTFQAQAP